jgi:hypothetical protein
MPIFRAEATLHDVEVEGGVYDGNIWAHSAGEVFFAAAGVTSGRRFGIFYAYAWINLDPLGPGFWVLVTEMAPTDSANATSDIYNDGLVFEPDGMGGFASYTLRGTDTEQQTYKTGGMIAVEKDTGAETFTFITPVGSIIVPFAHLEEATFSLPAVDPMEPLMAIRMGHGFLRTGGDLEHEQARWTDFRSLIDGDEWHGHTLSSSDPGTWGAWLDVSPGSTPFGSQAGPTQTTENAQLANGYLTRFRYNTADGTRDFYARELRQLNDVMGDGAIDMARAPEHALIWEAAVLPYKTHQLVWRRSHVSGKLWEKGIIYEEGGKLMEWPSISYQYGVLTVFFSFDGVVYRTHSEDAGENWSTKVVLDYSGSFPRHIIHPDHPYLLYFFFDGSDIKVARSTDSGKTWIDAAPITIDTGIAPQQLDAEWNADGSVLVSYFDAGAWTQMRSRDAGANWEP